MLYYIYREKEYYTIYSSTILYIYKSLYIVYICMYTEIEWENLGNKRS